MAIIKKYVAENYTIDPVEVLQNFVERYVFISENERAYGIYKKDGTFKMETGEYKDFLDTFLEDIEKNTGIKNVACIKVRAFMLIVITKN